MGLFDPIWKTTNKYDIEKAKTKVNTITDKNKLKEIALNAPLEEVRAVAIGRIYDVNVLREIANTYKTEVIGFMNAYKLTAIILAAEKVFEKDELVDLALNIPDVVYYPPMGYKIVAKIKEQDDLVNILKNAKNSDIRLCVVDKVKDVDALKEVKNELETQRKESSGTALGSNDIGILIKKCDELIKVREQENYEESVHIMSWNVSSKLRLKLICERCGADAMLKSVSYWNDNDFVKNSYFTCKCGSNIGIKKKLVMTEEKVDPEKMIRLCPMCLKYQGDDDKGTNKGCDCASSFPPLYVVHDTSGMAKW